MNAHGTSDIVWGLFSAYNDSTGFDLQFNAAFERMLWDCAQMGLTPEMIMLVIRDRQKGIKVGERRAASLMPRNLFIGDDVINETIVEGKALLALKRKIIDPARTKVLAMTGRDESFQGISGGHEVNPPDGVKHVSDVSLMAALRRAAS